MNRQMGLLLQSICEDAGLRQRVRGPTRGDHLLDLVLSDVEDLSVDVLPAVADHRLVLSKLHLAVPEIIEEDRLVWNFGKADWDAVVDALDEEAWEDLADENADDGVTRISAAVFSAMKMNISQKRLHRPKSSHPWLTDAAVAEIEKKIEAIGSEDEQRAAELCSAVIVGEYEKYKTRMREKLKEARPGTKYWWQLSRQLLQMKGRTSSIPALKDPDGTWAMGAADKAELFKKTFAAKQYLPVAVVNEYSALLQGPCRQEALGSVTAERVKEVLEALRVDSATGPDLLPTRVLKQCADALALQLQCSHSAFWRVVCGHRSG